MNQTIQSELHPSVEMLNAFAEQALGAQEYAQMTTHLAGCGRCREVVYLAQEAAFEEERFAGSAVAKASTQSEAEGLFRFGRWFGGWHFAWVGGLVVTCMVLVMISVRLLRPVEAPKTARIQLQPTAPVQAMQAKVVEPAPLQAAPTMPKPKSLRVREAKPNASAADKPASLSVDSDSNASAMVLSNKDVADLPIHGQNTQALLPQAAPQPQQAGIGGAQGLVVQQSSVGGPSQVMQFVVGQSQAGVAGRAAAAPKAAAPAAAAAPSSSVASSNATVEVNAASVDLDALSDDADAVSTLRVMAKKIQPLLPGDVPAVSSAESQGHRIAVDAAGHLFLSNDAGVTWQAVASQWSGRAVTVMAVTVARFELATESGAVWSSVDG
jgi:Putative zinc-finger